MFKDSGYAYKIVNNQILISTVKAVNVIEHQQQKSRTITGCVKDVNGEPIIGASVVEKGVATNGTVTDFEGNYTLTISSDELQISYIGYLPQVVKVHSGTSFYNVTLKEDTKTLDEVVVGYGTQKKVNLTGSVASVSSDEIKDRVQTDVLSSIQGTVPGVTSNYPHNFFSYLRGYCCFRDNNMFTCYFISQIIIFGNFIQYF